MEHPSYVAELDTAAAGDESPAAARKRIQELQHTLLSVQAENEKNERLLRVQSQIQVCSIALI